MITLSQQDFVRFLRTVRDDPAKLAEYDRRDLPQLVFHARTEGYDFSADDIAGVIGALEVSTILNKDGESIDGNSGLWRRMWGRRHLGYLVHHVVSRHSDVELTEAAS